jgi:hypothetical protein
VNDARVLTEQQAYAAMFLFLDRLWERNRGLVVGDILGDMSLLPDGVPADAAIRGEWTDAVERAFSGEPAGALRLS